MKWMYCSLKTLKDLIEIFTRQMEMMKKEGRALFSLILLDKIFGMSFDDGFDAMQSC